MRTLAGTRRVGHAGTLDPMATGVLVVGIGRATRLLGHISGADKSYDATIKLGWSTVSDDREGERLIGGTQEGAVADLTEAAIRAGIRQLTGTIMQRPAMVSAIKVEGRRSHERVRAGEQVDLPERPVTVSVFDLLDLRRDPDAGTLELEVRVTCSSGTYIRALARDLGDALAVGGHLTNLRRRRVGVFTLAHALRLDELDLSMQVMPIADAARAAFPSVTVSAPDAKAVRYGRSIDLGVAWARAAAAAADGQALDLPGGVPGFAATSDLLAPGATAGSPFLQGAASGSPSPPGPASNSPGHVRGADPAPSATAHADAPGWLTRPVAPHALFAPDGEFLALATSHPDGTTKYLAVFSQP